MLKNAEHYRTAAFASFKAAPTTNLMRIHHIIEDVTKQDQVHMSIKFHSTLTAEELAYLLYLGYEIEQLAEGSPYTISWFGCQLDETELYD
jgi:hypothetical protein